MAEGVMAQFTHGESGGEKAHLPFVLRWSFGLNVKGMANMLTMCETVITCSSRETKLAFINKPTHTKLSVQLPEHCSSGSRSFFLKPTLHSFL